MKNGKFLLMLVTLFIFALSVSCSKKGNEAEKKNQQQAKPQKKVEKKAKEPKEDELVKAVAEIKKNVTYCLKNYLDKMDYNNIRQGLPPVGNINFYDNDCKPIFEKYNEFAKKYANKYYELDNFITNLAIYSEGVYLLSRMMKKIGTRHLSELVKRMKEVQKKVQQQAMEVLKFNPVPESKMKTYRAFISANYGDNEKFEMLVKFLVTDMYNFYKNFVYKYASKKKMYFYEGFARQLEMLNKILSTKSPKSDYKKLIAICGQLLSLLKDEYQVSKLEKLTKELDSEFKKLTNEKK